MQSFRADPSKATRAEVAARATDSVVALGALSKAVAKASTSPALQSTIESFASCEKTIASTDGMLRKIARGLEDVGHSVDACADALSTTASSQQQQQQQG